MKFKIFNKITFASRATDLAGMRRLYDPFTLVTVLAKLREEKQYEDRYHIITHDRHP